MTLFTRCFRIAGLAVAASVLTACPAKDEKGLDFTKTQREALDKVKSLEQERADPALALENRMDEACCAPPCFMSFPVAFVLAGSLDRQMPVRSCCSLVP
ncbi:MAG: hypothetical protein IPQ15_18585 [Betaproteobacteria bacterium]|nr:hypothetical protein [Betaproteobacteria bacterium]